MEEGRVMELCPECRSTCPWCGNPRWQTRAVGCGAVSADHRAKSCRKSKRLQGVPCPKCGSVKPSGDEEN